MDLSKYKKLDEISHVLLRPGRYLGAVEPNESITYIIKNNKAEWNTIRYSPAFLKMFDEIISNSVDFSKKPEGKHVTEIKVTCNKDTGRISVFDNGGIPVVYHQEQEQWLPDMLLGELRAGSNFDDDKDSVSTGQNGEGAALTGIFSTYFKVDTSDGKKRFVRTYENNYRDKSDIVISKSKTHGTYIEYQADFERLGMECIDNDAFNIIKRRVYEIAATSPHLKVYFNNELIKQNNFSLYSKMFDDDVLTFETDKWKIGLTKSSENKFNHISFVNSTCTFTGGTHIDYVMDKIVSAVRDYIEKKTKQSIKPNDIKQHFFLILDCTINNPRYSSQTKDNLLTQPSAYGSGFDFTDKFIKLIIKSAIVEEIIDWANRKKELEDLNALKKLEKEKSKNSLRYITKYEPATSKDRSNCILFLAEGDCIEENTEIFTIDGVKKIKDICIGDYVFTHKHRFKRVISKSPSLKKAIKINGIFYSPEHKIYVYDSEEDVFKFIKTKDIIIKKHKLVRNELIKAGFENHIHSIKKLNGNMITLDNGMTLNISNNHIIFVLNGADIIEKPFHSIIESDLVFI